LQNSLEHESQMNTECHREECFFHVSIVHKLFKIKACNRGVHAQHDGASATTCQIGWVSLVESYQPTTPDRHRSHSSKIDCGFIKTLREPHTGNQIRQWAVASSRTRGTTSSPPLSFSPPSSPSSFLLFHRATTHKMTTVSLKHLHLKEKARQRRYRQMILTRERRPDDRQCLCRLLY
jgi:hypothetical protein